MDRHSPDNTAPSIGLPNPAFELPRCAPMAMADSLDAAPCLSRGEVLEMRLSSDTDFEYFAYLPHSAPRHAPILITVHGISRNARQQAEMMAELAECYGVALIAPLFRRRRFPGYQRLEADAHGSRPDVLLRQTLREFAQRSGASDRRLFLFGFSGGAQFVHRWVMRSPQRVSGYVLGAAGWYTFPDQESRYPHGLRGNHGLAMPALDADAFLRVRGLTVVGEFDRHRDRSLRSSRRVVERQGATRLERGRRWVAAMNEAARERGLPEPLSFKLLPAVPHCFALSMRRGEMGEQVFRFLFGDASQERPRSDPGVSSEVPRRPLRAPQCTSNGG